MRTIGRFSGLLWKIGATVVAVLAVIALMAGACFVGSSNLIEYWARADSDIGDVKTNQHTIMYDKNGNEFAEVWTENRKEVSSLDKVSRIMQDSVISAEDKGFRNHGAINITATIRSLATGSGGGSGITQQLIKNLLFYNDNATPEERKAAYETTMSRKLRELKMAMKYEETHSKDEILLEYLRTVAMGSPNIYGVETASETIFNKKAADLNLEEASALAGSINNPSMYNLMRMNDPAVKSRVKARQVYVLDRLLEDGRINRKDHDKAVKDDIHINIQQSSGGCGSSKYPFYCQYVMDWMLTDPMLGSTPEDRLRAVNAGGFEVRTYLDPAMLEQLENRLKSDWGVDNPKVQSTAVVQPGTGGVLALGANRDWGTDPNAGQTQIVLPESRTQTGSTYKMMTLSAALNAGWTESQLDSVSSACPWNKPGFDVPPGGINNSTSCALQGGHLTYRRATAYSANTWFVELESRIGVKAVKDFSASVGLDVPDTINDRSASFTLGVTDNSPISMAAAYATFANKGVYCPATPVESLRRTDGKAIIPPDDWNPSSRSCRSVMSPHSASVVLKAMDANINGTDISGRFGEGGAIAGHHTVGKSGTTNDWANQVWTQMVGQYVVYSNGYDPRGNFQHPMTYYIWRGYSNGALSESVMKTTRDFIADNLNGQPNVEFDMNNTDDRWQKPPDDDKDMIIVPNVVGMSPDQALATLNSLGLHGGVLKKPGRGGEAKNNSSWPDEVVVAQSITPGTKLMVGSKKVIDLTVSTGSYQQ